MHIYVFGLNHNTATLGIRESLYITEADIPTVLTTLKRHGLYEAVVLSTCNRTEVYFSTDTPDIFFKGIKDLLIEYSGVDREALERSSYLLRERDALRHLFLVASGLDSMVIGEPQILGQVKDAYRLSVNHNLTGFFINKVFHRAFSVAKRVRTETKIGHNPLSISSMAIGLAKRVFGEIKEKTVVVIGAGEVCEVTLRHIKKEGVKRVFVTNRTFEKAETLARGITGRPFYFNDMPLLLTEADIAITSTGADMPIIDKGLVRDIMKRRMDRPLVFIDIAVPRDVEPDVSDIKDVYLYNIDDLMELSAQHRTERQKESEMAIRIIDDEVAKLSRWIELLEVKPLITYIIDTVERIRTDELKRASSRLREMDNETIRQIEAITKTITNKLIHRHISIIKEDGSQEVMEVMRRIFGLEREDEEGMDNNRYKGQ